ncbi:MAG: glycosyltransferase family 39 protein [Chloroflexota bacterium]
MRPRIQRRPLVLTAISLTFALISVVFVVLRWQVAPQGITRVVLGDPSTQAAHFYDIEQSDAFAFRWSRTTSAVSLPALATSQVVSITLDPARPPNSPPPYFRLSVGIQSLGSFQAVPGLQTYTTTVGPGLSPDVRLVIDSDTFFPGVDDRRKLGMAVKEISTSAREGRAGLTLPPTLWLVIAALSPILAYFLVKPRRGEYWQLVGPIFALVPTIWSLLLPAPVALPSAAWVAGIAAFAGFLRAGYEWSRTGTGFFNRLAAIGRSRWELPAVAALTGVLSVVMTWPLVLRFGRTMPGWPMDNFAFLYKLWWFRTAVVERQQWPLFDPNSYAPFGFDLGQGEPTLVNTLPGIFIGTLSNDVAAYNILMLLSFVVSGLGAYLLVRELTGSKQAGLLGAVAFAFCPYRMAQMAGHIQLMGTGWIAFTFYFLERTVKTRSWRDGALLGLSLALTALSAWYYAYMVGLALGAYALARVWMLRKELPWRNLVKPAIAAGVVFLLLGGVAAIPSIRLWSQGGLTHSAKAADEHSASPLDYIIPNQLQPVWGEPSMRAHAEENLLETNLYLGVVVVAIAIAGWVVGRRARLAPIKAGRAWLGLFVGAIILSLGLTLHGLSGQLPGPIPLPGQLLFDWLPFYSSMRAYARFGVIAALALIVLMGMGWTYIIESKRPWLAKNARWLTLVAICAIMADFWTSPYTYAWGTSQVEASQTAMYIAMQAPGAVMQMPLAASQSGPLLYQGTYYGKPIAYGYDTFEPTGWKAERPALESFPDPASLDVLQRWGVRYLVVSSNAYGADWPGTSDFLKTLPRLKFVGDFQEHRTWDVDPAVLDAQPELLQYAEPDTMAVFELAP